MAKKQKQKNNKKDELGEVCWELFKRTGFASYYLFYKELDK